MKKTLILLFSFLFIWTSTFPVKASEIQPIDSTDIIEVFDDGSYIESFTEENIIITLSRSSSTKSARRTYTYKSSTGKTLWTITVTGTFSLYRKVRLWLLSKRKIAHIKVGRANR